MAKENVARKDITIGIRVTEDEKEWLMKKAEECTDIKKKDGQPALSCYVRQVLLSESGYKNHDVLQSLIRLRYEVNKIGTNINQVTKKIDAGFGRQSDIRILKEALADVQKAFLDMEQEVQNLWQSQN